jgi:uncharacterized protein YgiM (DUF1202 family)
MMNRYITPLRIAFLLVFLSASSATSAFAQGPPRGTVRVTAKVLNLRAGPGPNFKIVGSVSRGTLLKAIEFRGGWIRVRRPSGVVGWVYSEGVVRVN